jgi:hypothetical protein
MTKYLKKKNTAGSFSFFDQKFQFSILWTSKLQKKPSALKREPPALFLVLWVIFALLDPGPDPQHS